MRNKLLFTVFILATVFSPTVTVAEPGTLAKKSIPDEIVVENLKTTMESKVGETKEEIAAREIEANLQKINEQKKTQALAAAQAVARRKVTYVRPVVTNTSNADAVAYGHMRNAQVFGEQHWSALYQLWSRESGWRDTALNSRTGACGIPQFINGCVLGDHVSQIDRGMVYIQKRYGNPTNAWRFFLAHNWY